MNFLGTCKRIRKKGSLLYLIQSARNLFVLLSLRGPVRVSPHGSSVTTGGNWSTWRKPAMPGRVKLDNTLLTCDQGNFNQITARSRYQKLFTEVKERYASTLPTPRLINNKLAVVFE